MVVIIVVMAVVMIIMVKSCLHLVLAMVDQPLGSPQHRVVRPNQLSQMHLHFPLKTSNQTCFIRTYSDVGKVIVKKCPDRQEGGGVANLCMKKIVIFQPVSAAHQLFCLRHSLVPLVPFGEACRQAVNTPGLAVNTPREGPRL